VDTNDQWLVFGAVQYTVWTRLNLKFVFSSASNKVEHYRHGIYVNNALSGRFRAELLF
jgi:long-subunit fatty acid transport protein